MTIQRGVGADDGDRSEPLVAAGQPQQERRRQPEQVRVVANSRAASSFAADSSSSTTSTSSSPDVPVVHAVPVDPVSASSSSPLAVVPSARQRTQILRHQRLSPALLLRHRGRVLIPNPDPQARRRQTREAEADDDVSFVFPAKMMDLNPRSRLARDENNEQEERVNFIPDLPKEKGINYVFPFSPTLKRENRQTSPFTEEPLPTTTETIPEPEATTTAEAAVETTTEGRAEETTTLESSQDEDDGELDDYEVSVSVSQSVSETFSLSQLMGEIANAITSTIMPTTEVEEEEEEKSEGESVATATTTTATTTTESRRRHPFLSSKRKSSSLVPKIHPVLASKKTLLTTTPRGPVSRHPFFKQRTSLFATTTEALPETTTDAFVDEGAIDGEESTELPELPKEAADGQDDDVGVSETTTAPPTAGGLLANKIKERLMKEALAKKAAEEKEKQQESTASSSGKINFLSNRNARPKFQVPSSLRSRLQAKLANREETREEDNEVDDDATVVEATTRSATRSTSRFRPPAWSARTTRAPNRVTKPITRFTSAGGVSTVSASSTTEATVVRSTSRVRNRLNRPLDLSTSPSNNIFSRGRSRSRLVAAATAAPPTATTQATTTTTKLTVADIIAGLNGEQQVEEKPVTLRPKLFKPKFGNSQRDKVRQRLREQLENEETEEGSIATTGDDVSSIDAPLPSPPTASRASQTTATTGRRQILRTRGRTPAAQPRVTVETPRSSSVPAKQPSSRNSLRTRSRSRLAGISSRQPLEQGGRPGGSRRPISHLRTPQEGGSVSAPIPLSSHDPGAQPPTGPARELSDIDIMKGLGLAVDDGGAAAREGEVTSSTVAPTEFETVPPAIESGDALLLHIVKNNQKQEAGHQQQQQQQQQKQQQARPIMEDPSLIPPKNEEQQPATVPAAAFNPQDFLKTAVVESKLPPEVTAAPAPNIQEVPLVFAPAPEPEVPIREVVEEIPQPRQPEPARSRGRSRHRFLARQPAQPAVQPVTTAPRTTVRQPISRSRLRVRNRARTEATAPPTLTTQVNVRREEIAVTLSPEVTGRGRTRIANTRRRQPIKGRVVTETVEQTQAEVEERPVADEDQSNEIQVEEEDERANEVPLSRAPFGTRRSNLRTSARANSRVRARNRFRGRQQLKKTVNSQEQNGSEGEEEESLQAVSNNNNANRGSGNRAALSGRVRSRFVGKSKQSVAAGHHDSQVPVTPTTITTTPSVVGSGLSLPEEEEQAATLRTGNFRPQFGARQKVRERLQQARLKEEGVEEEAVTELPTTTEFFKSVSPSLGVTALPASFFASFPASLFTDDGGIEVTTPRSSRVERSTVSLAKGLTTQDYNKLGVSGHAFKDLAEEEGAEIATTPTTFTKTTTTVTTAKTTTMTTVEAETTVSPKKKIFKKKFKITKGLFGRKRPNFLKALKDSNKEEKKSNGNNAASFYSKKLSALSKLEAIAAGVSPDQVVTTADPSPPAAAEEEEVATTTFRSTGGFSLRPFKRPRRKLNLEGLKDLFQTKDDEEKKKDDGLLKDPPSPPPFVPTPATEKPDLTGLADVAKALADELVSSPDPSPKTKKGKKKKIQQQEEEDGKSLLSKHLKKGGLLKARLRNRFKYGRKTADANDLANQLLSDNNLPGHSSTFSSISSSPSPTPSSSSPNTSPSSGSQVLRGSHSPRLPPVLSLSSPHPLHLL